MAIRSALAVAAVLLTACAASPLDLVHHPLAGRVWDTRAQRFIEPAEAERRIAAADIALLGETHDNPAHHEIQRRLLELMSAGPRRPALALEQIDSEWQSAVDAARGTGSTPEAVRKAGNVAAGWSWPLYEPLVTLALERNLPIVAANLSRTRSRPVAQGGFSALGEGEAERLALAGPWNAEKHASLRRVLVLGHCGEDSPMIDRIVNVQRARDAVMADRILAAPDGVVAIIGRGHARADLGVPLYLAQRAPQRRVVSVGLVEVVRDARAPGAYAEASPQAHDLVWFTPRAKREDPCIEFLRAKATPAAR